MTVGEMLRLAEEALTGAGVEGPGRDARVLLAAALGVEPGRLTLERDREVGGEAEKLFGTYLAARAARQPVAQITGYREFWGRRFKVTRDVLDPRPDTETLIEAALTGPGPARLLDLGTGSGILAITLLAEWPQARAVATDISEAALAVARQNAEALAVAGRLELVRSDWFAAVAGRFDLVVSNPPYIAADEMAGLQPEVRDWEPRQALTPEGDGLAAYRAIARGLRRVLNPGGRALFEIGHSQAAAVAAIFRDQGWNAPVIHKDLAGKDRVIALQQGP